MKLYELQSTPANPDTEGTEEKRPDLPESGLAELRQIRTRVRICRSLYNFDLYEMINSSCVVKITGKPLNQGQKMGMQVPCTLKFTGDPPILKKLQSLIQKVNE